jgi:hypothetical protein
MEFRNKLSKGDWATAFAGVINLEGSWWLVLPLLWSEKVSVQLVREITDEDFINSL